MISIKLWIYMLKHILEHNENYLLIRNVLIPFQNSIVKKDILIKGEKIYKIDDYIKNKKYYELIDGKNKYLFPGFIDIHTHLDCKIGKYYVADNYNSASRIAIDNGITTLFNFITQTKQEEPLLTINQEIEKIKLQETFCNIYFHFTPFKENHIETLKQLDNKIIRTIKLYTTYKNAGLFYSYPEIKKIFEELKDKNFTFLIHCEDEKQLENDLKEVIEFKKPYSHSIARSKRAEIIAVKEIIKLSRKYNQKVHIVHVSTPEAAKLIYKAKLEGVPITSEICPQYLVLSSDLLKKEDGHRYICSPPIRDKSSRQKNIKNILEGIYDVAATDHCPFLKNDKDNWKNDYREIPNGLPGIGALPHIIISIFREYDEKTLLNIYKLLCENPAKVTDLYPKKGVIKEGSDADLVLFDIKKNSKYKIKSTYSDCYDPYEKYFSKLKIKYVILDGNIRVKKNG